MMLHILFTLFSTLCQIIPLAGPTMVYGGGTVSTPVDSPGTGTYSSAQTITITSTNSTSIYYTVDGSTPACPSTGTLYSGGFTSPSSTFTLQAIGCRTGWTSSGIDTSNYTISGGSGCTPKTGYNHCRPLTVGTTTAALTAFPVVTQASGSAMVLGASRIQNSSCYDVVFTSDSGGTTLIPWEIESCTQSTGAVLAWFPTATSTSVSTTIYVSYGNASISTAQNTGSYAPTNVWDSNYVGVWHLPNGASLTANDSTSNTNNGILQNTPTATTGQMDGGANFVSGSSQYISTANLVNTNHVTESAWVKVASYPSFPGSVIFFANGNGSGTTDKQLYIETSGLASFEVFDGGDEIVTSSSAIGTGSWVYLVGVYDGTNQLIYVNGNSLGIKTGTTSSYTGYSVPNIFIDGAASAGSSPFYLSAAIDEARVSSTGRSAAWIAAEYANQGPSGTLFSVGAEH